MLILLKSLRGTGWSLDARWERNRQIWRRAWPARWGRDECPRQTGLHETQAVLPQSSEYRLELRQCWAFLTLFPAAAHPDASACLPSPCVWPTPWTSRVSPLTTPHTGPFTLHPALCSLSHFRRHLCSSSQGVLGLIFQIGFIPFRETSVSFIVVVRVLLYFHLGLRQKRICMLK